MTVLTISTLNNAKDRLSQFIAGDRKLIGVGIVLPSAEPMKIALIDVTEEVNQGRLNTEDSNLVNAFIHSHQEEIHKQIKERFTLSARCAGTF